MLSNSCLVSIPFSKKDFILKGGSEITLGRQLSLLDPCEHSVCVGTCV